MNIHQCNNNYQKRNKKMAKVLSEIKMRFNNVYRSSHQGAIKVLWLHFCYNSLFHPAMKLAMILQLEH